MKKFGLLFWVSLMPFIMINSQSFDDHRSKQSGNWNSTSSWEVFDGTNWINAVSTPTNSNGVITIRNGHTITITAALAYDQVIVEQGGQVIVGAGFTTTLTNGLDTDLTINGSWLNSGDTWTISSGASWAVSATGTYIHNTGSSVTTPLNSVTLDDSSTFTYLGNPGLRPAIATSGRTYGNLRFETSVGGWLIDPFVSGTGTLTVLGNFYVASGINYNTAQTGIMTFAGNFTIDGLLTNGTGTQAYNFTGVNKLIGGSTATLSFEDVTIANGASYQLERNISILTGFTLTVNGTLNCNSNIILGAGNFTLASGGILSIGSSDGITSSGSAGNVQVAGTRLFNTAASYIYNGTIAQNTGNALPASLSGKLTINNSAGVTLSAGVVISGTLELINGNVFPSDVNRLRLTEYAALVGGSSSSFVDGPFFNSWTNLSGTKFYPIGKNSTYRPVEISFTSPNYPRLSIELIDSDAGGSYGTPLNQISSVRYYQSVLSSGTAVNGGTIKLTYGSDDGIADHNNLVVAQSSSSSGLYASLDRTTSSSTTVTSGTSYNPVLGSYFLLGTIGADPLPVELSAFSASVIGTNVNLTWRTETEVNNFGFEVERCVLSPERQTWNKIGFVNGNGNSNSPKNYSFIDDKVSAAKYSYRLKQIDNDGQFEYSKTINVDFDGVKKFELSQNYPNPFNPTTTIRFNLPEAGNVKLTLFNILGQEIMTLLNDYKESGVHTINFDASDLPAGRQGLNSGMYIYKIESGSFTQTKKMTLVK